MKPSNNKKPSNRAVIWTMVGLFFAAFFYIGIQSEIHENKMNKKKEKEEVVSNAEKAENDEEYIEWFEDHVKRFHEAHEEYEAALVDQPYNVMAELRDEVLDIALEVSEFKAPSNSSFFSIHLDYVRATNLYSQALQSDPYDEDTKEMRAEAKEMEHKVVEEFVDRKEDVYEEE